MADRSKDHATNLARHPAADGEPVRGGNAGRVDGRPAPGAFRHQARRGRLRRPGRPARPDGPGASAAASSATSTTPRMRSRPPSWSWPARPARSGSRESVGGWLHRVARRVAVESRGRAAGGRRERTRAVMEPSVRRRRPRPGGRRRPSTRRSAGCRRSTGAPVVLCDLEELTRDQAAVRLGWPPGTVAGRLARARDLLRDRLVRRGLVVAGGSFATVAAPQGASAAVPLAWANSAVLAAMEMNAGRIWVAGVASAGARRIWRKERSGR